MATGASSATARPAGQQRAVKAALAHPVSVGMSDRAIAKHIGVSHETVSQWRGKISPSLSKSDSETECVLPVSSIRERKCSDGRVMNTANIGRKPQSFDGGTRVAMEAAIGAEMMPLLQDEARNRQREHAGTAPGRAKVTLPAKSPEVLREPPNDLRGDARDIAGNAVGVRTQ